jgi:hypothetical protein
MSEPLLISTSEAAEALRMLTARVVRLANAGAIPCVRLPDGELRFDLADLRAWVDEHKRQSPASETRRGAG